MSLICLIRLQLFLKILKLLVVALVAKAIKNGFVFSDGGPYLKARVKNRMIEKLLSV